MSCINVEIAPCRCGVASRCTWFVISTNAHARLARVPRQQLKVIRAIVTAEETCVAIVPALYQMLGKPGKSVRGRRGMEDSWADDTSVADHRVREVQIPRRTSVENSG